MGTLSNIFMVSAWCWAGISCLFTVLPTLGSIIILSSAISKTLEIRFAAWSPTNGTGDIPTGYVVHWRLNDSMTWNLGLNVLHFGDTAEYVAEIDNLEPDTPYVVRVIPFISENNRVYPGFPTEGGPFWTLGKCEWYILPAFLWIKFCVTFIFDRYKHANYVLSYAYMDSCFLISWELHVSNRHTCVNVFIFPLDKGINNALM